MARPAKGDEIMHQQRSVFLGVLAGVAVFTAGCGPTDDGIGTKVRMNLTADETVKAAQLNVGVQKKVVTLSGTVDTSAVKERAIAVARGTDGVADVVDQITVKQLASGHGPGHGGEMMGKGMQEGMDHAKEGKRE
jgi:osmotically-inducible protein OsmY